MLDVGLVVPVCFFASGVDVKKTLPGFQRKLMLWPIPVVHGEMLTSKETHKPNDTKDLATKL